MEITPKWASHSDGYCSLGPLKDLHEMDATFPLGIIAPIDRGIPIALIFLNVLRKFKGQHTYFF